MPYGISQVEWDATVKEILCVLGDRAKNMVGQETISYSDLYNQINHLIHTSPMLGPDDPRFHHMLGEVSTAENKAGRGMLSVLVVHKTGDMKPGQGFYDLARQLGYIFSDEDAFWIGQFNKVCRAWRA